MFSSSASGKVEQGHILISEFIQTCKNKSKSEFELEIIDELKQSIHAGIIAIDLCSPNLLHFFSFFITNTHKQMHSDVTVLQ